MTSVFRTVTDARRREMLTDRPRPVRVRIDTEAGNEIAGGRLQQLDAPDAFFETRRSVDVAWFFGGTNFFPGRYRNGRIATAIGRFQAPRSAIFGGMRC